MFCKKCGIQLEEGAVFCPDCGEKVERNVNSSPGERYNMQMKENNVDYLGALKENSNGFLYYVISVIKEPVMKLEKLNTLLKGNLVYLYLVIVLLANSLISWSQSKVVFKAIRSLSFDLYDFQDIMGAALFEMDSKIILYGLLLNLLIYFILGALMILIYRLIMKVQISFTEIMKLICNAVVILMFLNLIILIFGILSLKLMLITSVLAGLIFVAVINVQCISNLGYKARFIYTFPIMWCIAIIAAVYLYIKLLI